jgi:hypothetical protein
VVINDVADEFSPLAVVATLELLAVEESLDLIEVTHVQSSGLPHLNWLGSVELRHAGTHWRELIRLPVHWRHPHWLSGEGRRRLHHWGRRKHEGGGMTGLLHWSHLRRLHLNGCLLLLGLTFLLILALSLIAIVGSVLLDTTPLGSVLVVVVPPALIVLTAIEQLQDAESSSELLT